MKEPKQDPTPTEGQLWSRLRRLKQRKERINAAIDAEVSKIKATLENALNEQ